MISELEPGDSVDGFVVDTLHTRRPFHYLYRVSHPQHHNIPLIMKVPRMSPVMPASVITCFETEIRILSRLRGVYTPKVYAKGDVASKPYLVMEYIEQNDLQRAVQQAPVPAEIACQLMIPVCKAVHELHRHNIIHFDLKPGNLRNREDGRAVILDFGTAHHSGTPDLYQDPHKKAPRSYAYVSPEQLRDVRDDSRSDLYALGVTLYQLATGRLPFGKGDPLSVRKRLYFPPLPPRALNPDLPQWLQEIILKCLQANPGERYASAKQVAYKLSHPDMVELSDLSEQAQKPGFLQLLRYWNKNRRLSYKTQQPHERISSAAHVLVALDLDSCSEDLLRALSNTLQRMGQGRQLYFTAVTVVSNTQPREREDFSEQLDHDSPTHMQRLAELKHWMKRLGVAQKRLNCQVLEGHPATEILAYAKYHVVDHIVMCARGSSTLRRYMGSVSSKVVAEAHCSVTVVRTRLD